MSVAPGSIIHGNKGHYRVNSVLRRGGMAIIHTGTSYTGESVIIKTPRVVGDGKDEARHEKLRVEAQILAGLNHRNIVRYVDERDEGQTFYLVIGMVKGPTLMEKFRHHPIDEPAAKDLALDLLDALKYVHEYNIIHRDISPSNIMLEDSKQPVLIDWGAAKQGWIQLNVGFTQIGKPGWSAPEQFTTGVVTPCSDLYALGAVLFYLLTGREPRLHMSSGGGLLRMPRDINRSVSQEMSTIVKTAMDPDCSKRFQTATDMMNMISNGSFVEIGGPHIVFQGVKHEIKHEIEIGRVHPRCQNCRPGGPPDIAVKDPKSYLSKHHARLSRDRVGTCWIEDLGSVNRTALSRDAGQSFRILGARVKERLLHNDVVAIVYSPRKGPYMTFTFVER